MFNYQQWGPYLLHPKTLTFEHETRILIFKAHVRGIREWIKFRGFQPRWCCAAPPDRLPSLGGRLTPIRAEMPPAAEVLRCYCLMVVVLLVVVPPVTGSVADLLCVSELPAVPSL